MENKVRIGFCGVGSMGQCAHLRNYYTLSDCVVVAIAEMREKTACRVAERYGVPKIYESAEEHGFDLLLAGHTHGGQICLPNGTVLVEGASVPYKFVKGQWAYNGLTGYTSRGAGPSCIAVRFFCPPEVSFITLKRK